ncbi:MAG: hypothetical protein OXE40_08490 [Gammaproteobacteria bacterium]|nr:hypothetical protein [Gammaproteobacteria bacterium]
MRPSSVAEIRRSFPCRARALGQASFNGVALALALLWSQPSFSHGGVVAEEDLCLMEMGFLKAHFTLYLPDTRGSEEFCEQVPDTGRALFVVEYLHEMMKEMPVEFRIVRDEQGFGIFANRDDVMSIPDLDAQTVFHRPLAAEPTGWVTVSHTFDDPGGYIGVVVAENLANGKIYNSVFYFEVGNAGYGYIPLFIALIVGAQLMFFASTGSLQRFVRWIRNRYRGQLSSIRTDRD